MEWEATLNLAKTPAKPCQIFFLIKLYMPFKRKYGIKRRQGKKSGFVSFKKRPVVNRKRQATKNFKRMVTRIIHKNVENKLITSGFTAGLYPISSGGNFISNNIFPLSPHTEATYPAGAQLIISQGSGDGNRIGNRVRTSRVMLRGMLWSNPYNASTNTINCPIEVCLWVFRLKPGFADTYVNAQSVLANSIFKIGNNVAGITNTMLDFNYPINTDMIILKKRKVFKLGNAAQYNTVGSVNSNLYANNDFKLNQRFSLNVTKYVNKNVSYKDTDNNPTSRTTWCALTFANADNSTPLSTNIPASFNYFVEYQYEDA